jgi:hypothetical protein
MYDKQYYKDWYEKTKPKRHVWQKAYYQKRKEHLLQMHKDWAKRNVDQAGSVWRKYGRWSRIRNPNIDKEYYARHREEILHKKKIYYRKKEGLMYKPLPDSLTISQSGIDGLGLFAKEGLAQGTNLGMSHLKIGKTIFRTPLGGFINHANDHNCVKVELQMTNMDKPDLKYDYKKWNLITVRDIKKGEELTVRYTFYNI